MSFQQQQISYRIWLCIENRQLTLIRMEPRLFTSCVQGSIHIQIGKQPRFCKETWLWPSSRWRQRIDQRETLEPVSLSRDINTQSATANTSHTRCVNQQILCPILKLHTSDTCRCIFHFFFSLSRVISVIWHTLCYKSLHFDGSL